MGIMDKMAGSVAGKYFSGMSPEDKQKLINDMLPGMMDKYFEGMTTEDKQKLIFGMAPAAIPKLLEGLELKEVVAKLLIAVPKVVTDVISAFKIALETIPDSAKEKTYKVFMEMMPVIMQRVMPVMLEGKKVDDCMPKMMMEMMPFCLNELLPIIPKEQRIDFVSELISALNTQGSAEMNKEEKEKFLKQIIDLVKA